MERLAEEEEIIAWVREETLTKTCCMLDPTVLFMAVLSAQVCALLALERARTMQIKVNADARQLTDHTATKRNHLEKYSVAWLIYRDLLAKKSACV